MIQLCPPDFLRQLPVAIDPNLGEPGIAIERHGPRNDAATVPSCQIGKGMAAPHRDDVDKEVRFLPSRLNV